MPLSLRARVVYPVDRPPIENGIVTIDGEWVVAVGTCAEVSNSFDLGDVALLPGFVNAHTHLEFSHRSQPLGTAGLSLPEWIRLVISERGSSNSHAAIASGIAESLRSGVTSIGEIATAGAASFSDSTVDLSTFVEVIGFSRARAESALSAVTQRLNEFASRTHLHAGISPHAPYTVSPALLSRLIRVAQERDLPVAMHLAESPEELEFLACGIGPFQRLLEERSMWDAEAVPRGSRPLDYLRKLAEAPRALVIHGNYLDAEEKAFLTAHQDRMTLVYCPRTHAYFGHPPYPLPELLATGMRVALGTDSRASNPDLSLLAEMRHVARSFPQIDPTAILRMGTLSGAEALCRDAEFGSTTPGKLANLVAMPLTNGRAKSAENALNQLLHGNSAVQRVWLRGEAVLQD